MNYAKSFPTKNIPHYPFRPLYYFTHSKFSAVFKTTEFQIPVLLNLDIINSMEETKTSLKDVKTDNKHSQTQV